MVGLVLLITILDFTMQVIFLALLGFPILFALFMLFSNTYKNQLKDTSTEQRRWFIFRLITNFILIIGLILPIFFVQLSLRSLFTTTLIILIIIYVYLLIRDCYLMNYQNKNYSWNKNIDEIFFSFI